MQHSRLDLQNFAKAAHSLKLYRRADLRDDTSDEPLINQLYVDPLQNDSVLETMLRDSTTFLIGARARASQRFSSVRNMSCVQSKTPFPPMWTSRRYMKPPTLM